MNKKSISIRGKVRNIGADKVSKVFEQNPYMAEIYPQEESRMTLEVFQVYKGSGKCFDLTVKSLIIHQDICLHYENCMVVYPFGAVKIDNGEVYVWQFI